MACSKTDDPVEMTEVSNSVDIDAAYAAFAPLLEAVPDERYRCEPYPRAKPHERLTHGIRPEDFFGICAEEFDDEFMESLRAIRRGVWSMERQS